MRDGQANFASPWPRLVFRNSKDGFAIGTKSFVLNNYYFKCFSELVLNVAVLQWVAGSREYHYADGH